MLNNLDSIQKKAIKHLRIALRNDHEHLPSIVSLCDILIESKNYDEAQIILKTAVKQSTESAALYYQQEYLLKFFVTKKLYLALRNPLICKQMNQNHIG